MSKPSFRNLTPDTRNSPFAPKLARFERTRKRRGVQIAVGISGMNPRETFDTGRTGELSDAIDDRR